MTSRLNILFVTPWYPTSEYPYWGIFVREHARAVATIHNVTVLHTIGDSPDLDVPYSLERKSVEAGTGEIPTYVLRNHRPAIQKVRHFRRHQTIRKALAQITKDGFLPDILHVHMNRVALPTLLYGKRRRIPTVITEQNSAFARNTLSRLELEEARIAFRAANRVMPVSHALQAAIESRGIRARFELVPNVVDTELFSPHQEKDDRSNRLEILCVANMPDSHIKGHPTLFQALAQLEAPTPWHLTLIGDGSQMQEYRGHVQSLGLADCITFLGYQTKKQIVAAMHEADFFVLASLWDNMPCVIIEAMATGLPVVATRTGGIPEMVPAEVGILAEPGDANALQTALNEMIIQIDRFHPQEIVRIARDSYSVKVIAQRFSRIYREALGRPTGDDMMDAAT